MTQRTIEISQQQWPSYLSRLDAQVRDRSVRVELVSRSLGDQVLARAVRLRSIALNTKGATQGTIELDLGSEGQVDHRIIQPERIYARLSEAGEITCLDIEDGSQTKTLIFFEQPPALPAE